MKKRKIKFKNPLKGKGKGLVKNIGKGFSHTIVKTKTLVKTAVKGVTKGVTSAALIPYVLPMKAALKQKGIKTFPKDRIALAKLFLDNVVRNNFEIIDAERPSAKLFNLENMDVAAMGTGMIEKSGKDAMNVTTIIKAVVDFFKNMKAKKDSGEPLTDLEQKLADAGEKVDEAVEQVTGETGIDAVKDVGGMAGTDWNKILMYAAIILVGGFIVKKYVM